MSDWTTGTLADTIASLDAGVSVNAEDRPHGAGEIGVLKTSAISGGAFLTEQNKTVLLHECRLVAEPVQADSILVSRMNTPVLVGESCYVGEAHPTLFLPDRLWQLKPRDRAQLSMRWLSFVLQSADYRRYVEVHATGTSGSMKNLPKSKLLAFPVHYPAPAEQSVIVKILDTLDTAIRQTEALIEKLKAVKQGLLHDLLTRGIDSNGQLRPPQSEAPQLYKESPLGWIPREWQCTDLAKRLARITYGFTSPMPTTNEGPWMLTATDVLESRILYEQARHTTERAFRLLSAKSRPNVGDVLVTKDGTLGRVAVLDRDDVCVNQSVAVLSPKAGADSSYLATYLQSPIGQERMLADSGGSTIKHLYISKLAEMSTPWPEEHEMDAIVSRISSMTARLENEESSLSKLNRQKSGLMDDLLTGRVRVTPLLESMQPYAAPTEA
ncbi:restriction endonuclease subunit S [Pseudomonas sp. NA13]